MDRRTALARSRRVWDEAAPRYDQQIRLVDRWLFADEREWVCDRATGDALEVGIGTGRNLPFYRPEVRLTGVDLSAAMLAEASRRAAGDPRTGSDPRAKSGPRAVALCQADAQALPFPGASFDSVVCTLSLCNVPDDAAAVAEMARVLRPGGRLLLLDHVASSWPPVWLLQRLAELLTVRLAVEHLTRRPRTVLARVGLEVVEARRLKLGAVERVHARLRPGLE